MRTHRLFVHGGVLVILLAIAARGESYFSLGIGPFWPGVLLREDHKRTAWDATARFGMMFDRRVAFGAGGDFAWNWFVEEEEDPSGALIVTSARKSFMFPVYGFLLFDPFPDLLVVHPSLEINVGYNSLIFRTQTVDPEYYYGVMVRLQANATYDLGENVGLTAGVGYTWANTRRDLDGGRLRRRDMSGVGLQAGFRFIL